MKRQTKRPLASGRRVLCGVCLGLAKHKNVSCERECKNGYVLALVPSLKKAS
jgi:hypothetical protein